MIEPSEIDSATAGPWFVIWSASRAEKQVEKRLAAMGLPTWLPTLKERHRWSDRWRIVESPLFPGYLFTRATDADWHRILRTPGVLTVITERGKPARLADSFISMLREAIGREGAAPEAVTDHAEHQVGDEVIVQDGAFQGLRGVVRERRSRRQLVLWVAQIGRGVAFTIGSALVRGVSRPDPGAPSFNE